MRRNVHSWQSASRFFLVVTLVEKEVRTVMLPASQWECLAAQQVTAVFPLTFHIRYALETGHAVS